jgi:hypothetical protein
MITFATEVYKPQEYEEKKVIYDYCRHDGDCRI